DDQTIVNFVNISEYQLLIMKSGSTHALTGPNDPNSWDVATVDPVVGLASVRAVAYVEGAVWWEALQGLFMAKYSPGEYAAAGQPQRADSPYISDRLENLNDALIGSSTATYDSSHQRLFFATPSILSTSRNDLLLPYNTKLNVFEDVWDPMDISALGT